MTRAEMEHILSELSGLTEYIYFHVMGEPLLHPKLEELIALAAARGFKCAITTNGTLLPERGEELLRSGVYKVNLSVHSFEDGSDGEYFAYLKGILDFSDRASEMGILTVVRLWNLGHDGGRNERTLAALHERFPGEWCEGKRGARLPKRGSP